MRQQIRYIRNLLREGPEHLIPILALWQVDAYPVMAVVGQESPRDCEFFPKLFSHFWMVRSALITDEEPDRNLVLLASP